LQSHISNQEPAQKTVGVTSLIKRAVRLKDEQSKNKDEVLHLLEVTQVGKSYRTGIKSVDEMNVAIDIWFEKTNSKVSQGILVAGISECIGTEAIRSTVGEPTRFRAPAPHDSLGSATHIYLGSNYRMEFEYRVRPSKEICLSSFYVDVKN
jgi:hypothetical protein